MSRLRFHTRNRSQGSPSVDWLLCHALSLLGVTLLLLPGDLHRHEAALPTFLKWINVD